MQLTARLFPQYFNNLQIKHEFPHMSQGVK